jgi:hypothetical protein
VTSSCRLKAQVIEAHLATRFHETIDRRAFSAAGARVIILRLGGTTGCSG